jgi:hypothetical protein
MTNKKDDTSERVAALEREVAELKSALPLKPKDPPSRLLTKEEQIAWQNEMDALRHRNESYVPPWLRDACAGGVGHADVQDIVHASHRPTGRPGVIPDPSHLRDNNPDGMTYYQPADGSVTESRNEHGRSGVEACDRGKFSGSRQ